MVENSVSSDIVRRMGFVESLCADAHRQVGRYIVRVVCVVSGPIAEHQLRLAAESLRQRHPMLNVTPQKVRGRWSFVRAPHAWATPLKLTPWVDDDDPVQALAELEGSLAPSSERLPWGVAACVNPAGTRAVLAMAFQHCLVDGVSATALLRECLTLVAGQPQGESYPLPPALEDHFPVERRTSFLRAAWNDIRMTLGVPGLPAHRRGEQRRHTRTLGLVFPGAVIETLRQRARSRALALQDLLAGAALRAAYRVTAKGLRREGRAFDLVICRPLDFRRHLPRAYRRPDCVFDAMETGYARLRVAPDEQALDLAVRLQRETQHRDRDDVARRLMGRFSALALSAILWLGARVPDLRRGIVVTHLGRDRGFAAGPYRALGFGNSVPAGGVLLFTLTTMQTAGQFLVLIGASRPEVDERLLREAVAAFVEALAVAPVPVHDGLVPTLLALHQAVSLAGEPDGPQGEGGLHEDHDRPDDRDPAPEAAQPARVAGLVNAAAAPIAAGQ